MDQIEIKSICDEDKFYLILFNKGNAIAVRKHPINTSDKQLTTNEMIIGALCRNILKKSSKCEELCGPQEHFILSCFGNYGEPVCSIK